MKQRYRFTIMGLIAAAILSLVVAGGIGAVLIVLWARRPPVLYEVTLLKTASGEPILPHAINNRGQVVGLVEALGQRHHIFLWDKDHGARDLGSYRIPRHGVLCVNDAGQVLVEVIDPNGTWGTCLLDPNRYGRPRHAWRNARNEWRALNHRGQLAGCSHTSTGAMHAAIWDRSTGVRDLGTLGGTHSWAVSINDKGQVTGFSETDIAESRLQHVFFWDPNTGMQDLGPRGPGSSTGLPLNEKGQVVGAFGVGAYPACISIWSQAQRRRPGPVMEDWFAAQVLALNDVNQLLVRVTSADIRLAEHYVGYRVADYLWDPNQGFVPLRRHMGRRGILAFRARDLNNRGQIVGELELKASQRTQGVLLHPVPKGGKRQ